MTSIKDKVRVKAGRLIRVKNKLRKWGANETYVAVWVENENGKNERCLLFTENQIAIAEDRAKKNKEDLTNKSWFTDLMD